MRNIFHKYAILFLPLLSCGCNTTTSTTTAAATPVNKIVTISISDSALGETTADTELQNDVLNQLRLIESAKNVNNKSNCTHRKLVNVKIIERFSQNAKQTRELWTIDRCGKAIKYDVEFIPDPKGGTFINIPLRPCKTGDENESGCLSDK